MLLVVIYIKATVVKGIVLMHDTNKLSSIKQAIVHTQYNVIVIIKIIGKIVVVMRRMKMYYSPQKYLKN